MKLATKMTTLTISVVAGMSISISVALYFNVTRTVEKQALDKLRVCQIGVQSMVQQVSAKARQTATLIAERDDVIQLVAEGNTAKLQPIAKAILKQAELDVLTIADKKATVVARGHSDKTGDSVQSQINVQKALTGEASCALEEGTVVKFSIRAGYPLRKGGEIIGSVTTGLDVGNNQFVDQIKTLYDTECTVFQGDTRVSTTLMQNGQRLVGTKSTDPSVVESVLKNGKSISLVAEIQGKSYNGIYWPIAGVEGKIIGMFFLGKDRSEVIAAYRRTLIWLGGVILLVGLLGISISWRWGVSLGKYLQTTIDKLNEGAREVTAAAQQVSTASSSLAEGASSQAASLEETSASLEEMASMTKRNAEGAEKTNVLARQARVAADTGVTDMKAMSQAMLAIQKSGGQIANIIKTIDEIAFQTNLLALNAAVEAARAGESGMGFAVVAEEVRNLAHRSAQAAKETSEKIQAAVSATSVGVQLSEKVQAGLDGIVSKVREVDQLAAESASASKEQNQGIEQLNSAVNNLDRVTQSNAASAEESASAATELHSQAQSLNISVDRLRQLVNG
jgi:hypothetical protein